MMVLEDSIVDLIIFYIATPLSITFGTIKILAGTFQEGFTEGIKRNVLKDFQYLIHFIAIFKIAQMIIECCDLAFFKAKNIDPAKAIVVDSEVLSHCKTTGIAKLATNDLGILFTMFYTLFYRMRVEDSSSHLVFL